MLRYLVPASLVLTACTPVADPVSGTMLPLFGDGYRFKGDLCRRLGEDDFTNQFLDDAADLVGCPADAENLGVFVADTGAIEVARRDGFVLYSIPVR